MPIRSNIIILIMLFIFLTTLCSPEIYADTPGDIVITVDGKQPENILAKPFMEKNVLYVNISDILNELHLKFVDLTEARNRYLIEAYELDKASRLFSLVNLDGKKIEFVYDSDVIIIDDCVEKLKSKVIYRNGVVYIPVIEVADKFDIACKYDNREASKLSLFTKEQQLEKTALLYKNYLAEEYEKWKEKGQVILDCKYADFNNDNKKELFLFILDNGKNRKLIMKVAKLYNNNVGILYETENVGIFHRNIKECRTYLCTNELDNERSPNFAVASSCVTDKGEYKSVHVYILEHRPALDTFYLTNEFNQKKPTVYGNRELEYLTQPGCTEDGGRKYEIAHVIHSQKKKDSILKRTMDFAVNFYPEEYEFFYKNNLVIDESDMEYIKNIFFVDYHTIQEIVDRFNINSVIEGSKNSYTTYQLKSNFLNFSVRAISIDEVIYDEKGFPTDRKEPKKFMIDSVVEISGDFEFLGIHENDDIYKVKEKLGEALKCTDPNDYNTYYLSFGNKLKAHFKFYDNSQIIKSIILTYGE